MYVYYFFKNFSLKKKITIIYNTNRCYISYIFVN
uniref:Uncharacterized protein n=1 Tax=Ascaris lumbricoides TaxID=6252 RepID=A0A0M3IT67_ASCLU